MQWGPNGTKIAQDWQQRQIGKKKPQPAQVWSGRRLPFVTPLPRSNKGQAPEQRQTSLWRKCEAAPKRRPRTSIRGQVGHDAHPKGRHGKDGHPHPQPASWQAFGQDKILSRVPEPRPDAHAICVRPPIPDPVPNAQVICKKSWGIGHRSADLISAAAHVPARA